MDAPPTSSKMSSETFSKYVMSIDDLYNMAIRNGFYMPKQSSSAVNELMISNILKGHYWCPKTEEIRMKSIRRHAPARQAVAGECDRHRRPHQRDLRQRLCGSARQDEAEGHRYHRTPYRALLGTTLVDLQEQSQAPEGHQRGAGHGEGHPPQEHQGHARRRDRAAGGAAGHVPADAAAQGHAGLHASAYERLGGGEGAVIKLISLIPGRLKLSS